MGEGGDNGKAAVHLLNCLLPYFAKVVIQDGIFWSHYWPQHEAVINFLRLLDVKGKKNYYLQWAHEQRLQLESLHYQEARRRSQIHEPIPTVQPQPAVQNPQIQGLLQRFTNIECLRYLEWVSKL